MSDGRAISSPATLWELLDQRAAETNDAPLLQVLEETRSASELRDRSHTVATALHDAGVRHGERVAIIADNCIELVELWFACARLGAILVPVNTAARGPQLAHVLSDSSPVGVVVQRDHLDRLLAADACPPSVEWLWMPGAASTETAGKWQVAPFPTQTHHDTRSSAMAPPGPAVIPSDIAALLYTSGTTGPAKGVMSPHSQLYWWGVHTAAALRVTPDDVLYNCLPLFHMNALNTVVQSLVTGARAVIGPRFSASRFWQRVIEADATVTYLLGAMVTILVSGNENGVAHNHRVRVILAPATPPAIWEQFEQRFGVQLVEGHGMTETNLAIGPRDCKQRPGWMGRAMPGFRARVVDESNCDVPAGTPGELLLAADDPSAFAQGYWGQPEQTAATWSDGWFRTGDRVVCDHDGYYRFLDRIKDSIRRRGENISAWEVEQALEAHPHVTAAAVVPTASDLGEDEVRAFVIPANNALDPVGLIRHCEPLLAYFAIPRYIDVVDQLPLTENGKVRKYVLRERPIDETTWDRERAGIELRR